MSETQDATLAVMEAALRVLTALSQKQPPNPVDVAHLVGFTRRQPERMEELDEFACMAVQLALKKRQDARRSSEG